ncbi:tannase/feruloyl esterase family alpha/beta hydrolase, partial [Salmonella enterica]|uniref:tannase/feruloyl esterase family alpha/beta hydrolase n=1 Tax=Salmonella enterica TaxID=28901 RepID=UPI0020C3F92D
IGYMRNFLYNDPDWNYTSYNVSIPAWANEENPGNIDITDFNFTAYKSLGRKILWYQGLADGRLPARASTDFFEYVVNAT